jgi:hypothetical protein
VTLEREVRTNLVYRNFTRVGAGKMPDAKTMGRWAGADQARQPLTKTPFPHNIKTSVGACLRE